jgi:nucleoside-diphosphate-sugar epimerase
METGKRVCLHTGVRGMVIHPAMVYERDGGVLEAMLMDVKRLGRVRIIGGGDICWTMVHRMDIAELYALVLEKGKHGENYNGSGVESIEVGKLADALTQRFKLSARPKILTLDEAVSAMGDWAIGYGLDQKMSSQKAICELGWTPRHTDVITDIG